MPTVRQTAEVTVNDLSDAANVMLTSDAYVFAADDAGAAEGGSCSTGIVCMIGATQVDCSVSNADITKPSAGVTTTVAKAAGSMSPVVTVTVTSALTQAVLDADGADVTIPVTFSYQGETVTVYKQFSLALARSGTDGAAAYAYFLSVSPGAIVRNSDGTYSASAITMSATRATVGSPSAYSGWFWVHSTTDGSTWTQVQKYTSSASSQTLTLPSMSGVVALRVTLHTAAPTEANRVDTQTVPVIDSVRGASGEDAYTVILGNEAHTFAATAPDGSTAAHAIASTAQVPVVAYKGATQVAATIGTINGLVTGLTAPVTSNGTTNAYFTATATTSLVTRQGVLVVPVTVDGHTFERRFSWSLAPMGETGEAGEDGLSMSITSDNGTTLRNNSGSTTLTAHVWQSGAEVTGSALAALGTIKWYKDGTYQSSKDGASLLVSASDVSRKAVFTAKLEG